MANPVLAKTAKEVADELDGAAYANLPPRSVQKFIKYKEQLLACGTHADDIGDILRGFIWDASDPDGLGDDD